MGLLFRRSVKILPGVRLNLSRSGLGVSAGVRGLRVGVDAKGRKYTSAGIPGTGISTRHYIGRTSAISQPADSGNRAIGSFCVLVLVLTAAAAGALLLLLLSR
jgi:hypothetical protein